MHIFTVAFLYGSSLLQLFHHLPPISSIGGLLLFFIILYRFINKITRIWLLGLFLGFYWSWLLADNYLQFKLPKNWEQNIVQVKGVIISIPKISSHLSSFLFHVESIENKSVSTIIKLTWQHPLKKLLVGDRWLLPVKLKKIHGASNPNNFDYEAWAFQNGIRASGYVIEKLKPIFLSHTFHYIISQLRQHIQENILAILPQSKTSHWIIALIIGERQGIPPSEWEVLRNTGCNHLMAIGGLHIGFIAGIAYAVTYWLWQKFPSFLLISPAPLVSSYASLIIAWFYSMLAGFSIPTQRASFMITIFLLSKLLQRVIPSWQSWCIALLAVLVINPLNVLSASLWLSFGTIALLIYGMDGRSASNWWWRWGRAQWLIAIGLLPLSLWLFNQYSIVSFLANSIAIPWIGFLVLPLCLLGMLLLLLSSTLTKVVLLLADKSLSILWLILTQLSHISWATWVQCIPNYLLLISATLGIIILLLPAGFPCRILGLLWLAPILFFRPVILANGEAKFTLLDVGQGLSAVVQTRNHALVFDAGARTSDTHDMGESVVLPYLHSQRIKKLNMLIVSHGDNDHRGGAYAILKKIPVETIMTSVPQLFLFQSVKLCLAGVSWEWDGVQFKFLHPAYEQLSLGNNSSCVLMISANNKNILLPGDIEKEAEKFLLVAGQDIKADILIAPHHGSTTSGLMEFITKIHPKFVLYATGYLNRYHFPHKVIKERYQNLGAIQYDTAKTGALEFILRANDDGAYLPEHHLYRLDHWHYWQDY